jgi:hypothetical protein
MTGRHVVHTASVLAALMAVASCGGGAKHVTSFATPASGGSMHGAYSETGARGHLRAGGSGASAGSATGVGVAPAPKLAASSAESASGLDSADQSIQVGLRAGSVDDNARFADYLAYRDDFAKEDLHTEDFDISERHIFTVTTTKGEPVIGADIAILDQQGNKVSELRTYADGRALWFPRTTDVGDAQDFTAVVSKGSASTSVDFDRNSLDHAVTLDADPSFSPPELDVEFLVDATGSMGDEIAQLKASLEGISARIEALPAHPDVRFALTIFRDHGDEFLTRTWNFSNDIAGFQKAIADVQADGGADYPEDVQQGLHDAIVKPSWREPGAVKLVFLIGDAPPHLNYQDDPHYTDDIVTAAQQGIKIESLAASGLNDQGEFIWRQLAEATLGQFLFLTYGPDDSTPHHVSGYTADNLDDLVVRLINNELSPTQPIDSQQQQR